MHRNYMPRKPTTKEDAVRSAALSLLKAIKAAEEIGLRVNWPRRVDELTSIRISETGRANPVRPTG